MQGGTLRGSLRRAVLNQRDEARLAENVWRISEGGADEQPASAVRLAHEVAVAIGLPVRGERRGQETAETQPVLLRQQHGDGERIGQIGGAGGEIRGGVAVQLLPRGGWQGEEAALEKSRAQFVQRRRARNGDIGNETAGLPVADDGLRGRQRCVGTDEQQQLPPLRRFRRL